MEAVIAKKKYMEDHFSRRDWPDDQFLKFRVLLLHDATCSKPFRCYKLLWYQSIVLALIQAAASEWRDWFPRISKVCKLVLDT